jgi:5-methylthioadenosine/S-adenosylhomocysteine deaminase
LNILIKNAFAVLPEGNVRNCSVCIKDGIIVSIGRVPEDFASDKVIDAADKLLVPGFVNAHTHVYMTVLRNRADDLDFTAWLFDNIIPMENKLTDNDAYWSMQLGFMEMLESGITSFLDMHMFPDVAVKATLDAGMRGVLSRGLQGGKDSMEAGRKRFEQAKADISKYKGISTIGFMLAPHAPYTCDEYYLKEAAELAGELGVGIHTHLSESMDEQNTIKQRYDMTPAEFYDRCGILRENTVCAHCVYLSESDMALLAERGTSVAHNAASNMKLGNGFADLPAMLKHGINVSLGTDSAASNNNLSILREIQLAGLIHKGTHCSATTVSAPEVFDMATLNGAKALGIADAVGEIKVGKCADLSLFDLNSPGFFPIGDPKAALCYSSAGLKADTVLVNGQILLEKGEFKTIDAERVRYEINAMTGRL